MKAGRRGRGGGVWGGGEGGRCLVATVGASPGKEKKTLTKRAKLRLLVVTVL